MNPSSKQPVQRSNEFQLTFIDASILPIRLGRELSRLKTDMRLLLPALKNDPVGFSRILLTHLLRHFRSWLSPQAIAGIATAIVVLTSAVLLVFLVDAGKRGKHVPEDSGESSSDTAVVLDLRRSELAGGGVQKNALGRVGLKHQSGEGSGAPGSSAHGGGSGGMGDRAPVSHGKIPPPSSIPAPIPPTPITKSPALPAAGIDIDPLLWTDVKYQVYGDPRSQSQVSSNGPGQGGGMGTKNGQGVGNGGGGGYGDGNDGNTGNGSRQLGCCGTGGAPPGDSDGRDRVLRQNEVEQKVRILFKPEPHYSEEARRNQITGTVVLKVVFSSDGEVAQIRAVNSLPFGLTERAIAAARQIKFVPAMRGGRAVSVYMQLEYNFNLY